MNFNETEKYLRGRYLLKFRNLTEAKEPTLKEFIAMFFTHNMGDTLFAARTDNPKIKGLKSVAGKLQTEHGKRRSLGDIFRICRYYYPQITLEEVFDALYERIRDKKANTSYCNQTHRRMYYNTEVDYGGNIYNKDTTDEFGMIWKDYPVKEEIKYEEDEDDDDDEDEDE